LIKTKGFLMAKPEIISTHLGELSENHRKYFNEYQLESSDPQGYFYRIEEFLAFVAFLNKKTTQDINRDDINAYIQEMKCSKYTNTTISGRLSAIAGFRDFLLTNHSDQFGDKFLNDLPKHELSAEKKWEGRILRLEEISLIRKYNRQVSRTPIRDSVIFESFYQLGLEKQLVENLVFNDDDLKMRPQLDDLVKKVRPEEITTSIINSYFERITFYLISEGVYLGGDKKLNSYDITKSHVANFITCPNCGRVLECTEKNWCFVRTEFDEEFHLVCVICQGKRNEI
jgi:C4-type Zn-finger protein